MKIKGIQYQPNSSVIFWAEYLDRIHKFCFFTKGFPTVLKKPMTFWQDFNMEFHQFAEEGKPYAVKVKSLTAVILHA